MNRKYAATGPEAEFEPGRCYARDDSQETMNTSTLVQKLWNYCNGPGLGRSLARSPAREHAGARVKLRLTPRDDGMSYGDHPRFRGDGLPQLTCLLFLKARPRPDRGMADERSRLPYDQPIPAPYAWPALVGRGTIRA